MQHEKGGNWVLTWFLRQNMLATNIPTMCQENEKTLDLLFPSLKRLQGVEAHGGR